MNKIAFFIVSIMLLTSCVGKKKYAEMLGKYDQAMQDYERTKGTLDNCEKTKADLTKEIGRKESEIKAKDNELAAERNRSKALEDQISYLKANNNTLLDRLSDLSVVSKTGAESIKASLEQLNDQNKYIQNLNSTMQRKDSLNLALVMNLKRSLEDINDQDVSVEVKKGVVYISISDKMLFKSGSSEIQPAAEVVLNKIARILNDYKELDILVEGHTDNVPITNSCVTDNWDLSAKRATSVVRTLQKKYAVKPERMTAGGRSEFIPKSTNDTAEGKATNRRTEIVILPKLDQFFQLAQPQSKK
jgi:chemotaxis protein MotB